MSKQKISVQRLQLGMYVAELDRPWVESPFHFQGFFVESAEDLEKLRQICQYVYVEEVSSPREDTDKTIRLSMNVRPGANPAPSRAEWQRISSEDRRVSFQRELQRAATTRDQTRRYVNKLLTDVRFGLAVDTEAAKQVVSGLVDDITENPETALWLTQLKNVHEYTAQHCINVAVLSIAFGAHLGFTAEHLRLIGLGALLHDVGKMRIPQPILDKPGRVTEEEFRILRRHPLEGYEMMKATGQVPAQALQIIRHHHERISGRGYPDGLRGEQISTAVRVVAICDVYDAMTSDRVYHERIMPDVALNAMYKMAPTEFGTELMHEFIRCVGIYPVGSLVELTSGALGVVMTRDSSNRLRPVVMLVKDRKGRDFVPRRYVSLAAQEATVGWRITRIVDPAHAGVDMEKLAAEELFSLGHQVVHLGSGSDFGVGAQG